MKNPFDKKQWSLTLALPYLRWPYIAELEILNPPWMTSKRIFSANANLVATEVEQDVQRSLYSFRRLTPKALLVPRFPII